MHRGHKNLIYLLSSETAPSKKGQLSILMLDSIIPYLKTKQTKQKTVGDSFMG